jgi:ribonuclease-3
MTHTSRANEDVSGGVTDNESLEFLGDAVLGFIVADLLFRELPSSSEGQKSKAKAVLVSTATLARQALDGGIEQARAFIAREFAPLIAEVRAGVPVGEDHKSALQEYTQSRNEPLPQYRLAGTFGPDHRKVFQIEVSVRGEVVASGSGASKKEAEQEAARQALQRLRNLEIG